MISLEKNDIEAIAQRVAILIKIPSCAPEDDAIFDVIALAAYLKVNKSWIYSAVDDKTIPYFKIGKFLRFRKSEIDEWTERQSIKPIPTR